jgi:hypothetical protein
MSNAEIARRLDQPHQAVSEWRKRFCQEGRVDRVAVDRVMDAARRVVLVGGEPAEPTARRRRHAGCTPTRSARTCMSDVWCSRETMPHHFRAPSARGRGDTRRAFMAGLARVGRMDVRRRARPPSWAVDGSGDRRIRGVGLPFQGSVLQMGGRRLLSGRGRTSAAGAARGAQGMVAREHGRAGRRRAERRGPACAGRSERVARRHHLFGCRDRWIAAGSYPLATSSRSCRACRYRGPRPSRAARRRSPRS